VRVKAVGEGEDISDIENEADETPITDGVTGDKIDFPEPTKPDIKIPPGGGETEHRRKVTINGVEVTVIKERVQYLGDDGKIITESLRDYTRKNIRASYASLDAFLTSWKESDRKRVIIEELEQHGVIFGALNEEIGSAFVPDYHYQDSLKTEYNSIGPKQQVEVILANPPFGAGIAEGVETNFPQSFRCRESADLFVILMIQLLKPGGRCAIVLPDGCITGDG